jgi:glycerol kinase
MQPRPAEPYFLALDQGGHSSRALVFSVTGEVIAQAQKAVTTQASHPDWVEQDAQSLVGSLRSVIADVHATSGRDAKHVRSVGGWPRSVPIASAGIDATARR